MGKKKLGVVGKFLRSIDYFGVTFSFRIRGNEAYQSRLGGGLFLFFILLSSVFFALSFLDFWRRLVYTVNYSVLVLTPSPKLNLSETRVMFAYSMQYENNYSSISPQMRSMLNQKMFLSTVVNSSDLNKEKQPIGYKSCELKDFQGKVDERTYRNLNFSQFYCAVPESNISIEGSFSDQIFQYLDFEVSIKESVFRNENSTHNLKYLQEEMRRNPMRILIYWTDTAFDVNSFHSPISGYLGFLQVYVDFKRLQKINMDFSLTRFSTDSFYIIRSPSRYNNVTFDKSHEYSLSLPDRDLLDYDLGKKLVKIFFRSSNYNTIIDRSYLKVTQLLANFGALTSNMLLVCMLFVRIFNCFRSNQKVINKIFKFREYELNCNLAQNRKLLNSFLHQNSRVSGGNDHQVNVNVDGGELRMKNLDKTRTLIELKEISLDSMSRKMQKAKSTVELEIKSLDSQAKIDVNIEDRERGMANIWKKKPTSLVKLSEDETVVSASHKPLSFSSFEIIMQYCPLRTSRLTSKLRLLDKASKKSEYYFDIFTYIKTLQEVNLLKYLLLSRDQQTVFKYLRRPVISMNYTESLNTYDELTANRFLKTSQSDTEIDELIKSQNNLLCQQDSVSSKLSELFNYEMERIFNIK